MRLERHYFWGAAFPYTTFIITDLKMPQMSGLEVLAHIKANPAFAVIPTVVLTASSDGSWHNRVKVRGSGS
jgi:CheY-like chemotaxis protein